MFTGLIEAVVPVAGWERVGTGARLVLPAPAVFEDRSLSGVPAESVWRVAHGESVAVSGVCLTVVALLGAGGTPQPSGTPGTQMVFDLSSETLERAWFDQLDVGRAVNLERSLRLGDRLGGHLVAGHVDGQGTITAIEDTGDGGWRVEFQAPPELARYLIEKGSVTIDGISLTVVEPEGRRFQVAVIPLTLELTSLGAAKVGDRVNLEADMIGKWIERLVPR